MIPGIRRFSASLDRCWGPTWQNSIPRSQRWGAGCYPGDCLLQVKPGPVVKYNLLSNSLAKSWSSTLWTQRVPLTQWPSSPMFSLSNGRSSSLRSKLKWVLTSGPWLPVNICVLREHWGTQHLSVAISHITTGVLVRMESLGDSTHLQSRLGRFRQEHYEFEARLVFITRSYLRKEAVGAETWLSGKRHLLPSLMASVFRRTTW